MWSPDVDEFQADDAVVRAEYRTDKYHVRILRLDSGVFVLQHRSRDFRPELDLYTPWTGWTLEMENPHFAKIMWAFARQVLERSAVEEYYWGAEARHL